MTLSLRAIALLYLLALLALPVGVVFFKTFQHGFGVAWAWMTTPAAISALWLSLLMAAIAVPLNTVFGVGCALVLVRRPGRATAVLDALVDLPFLVSPVVVGLALTLVYGIHGWCGTWFSDHGVRIIYALPGMALATVFVSLPFVAREVVPVLREIGAVLVVSSLVAGQTLTLPLLVYQRDADLRAGSITSAYAAATELVVISLLVLLVMTVLSPRRQDTHR